MSNAFQIRGGKPLSGEITPQGAKNEALQILCAVLLTSDEVRIKNIPDIKDVNQLIDILKDMGVIITKNGKGDYSFKADNINFDYIKSPEFKKNATKLRGSVMILGPLLARYGEAYLPTPGGDKIGRRRLDTHFQGFVELGAEFHFDEIESFYSLQAKELHGKFILLEEASVTGTANILMAAVLAKGKTRIYNAACEPYLQQLCKMLNRMGAQISGIGSNLLTIEGVNHLSGTDHTMLPDMVEIGSWIGLAAMTKSAISIKNVNWNQLGVIPETFRKLGIKVEKDGEDIYVPAQEFYTINKFIDGSILTISDAPWPGFTPDLLSIILVVATQAKGTLLVHQKMFESRLFFVDKLIDMGAQIILCDPHRATVVGLNHESPLRGTTMTSPDIRAGNALLIAALSAEGESLIYNIEQIDRGYENIDDRLRALGADIRRI
ncbi:UDP-N-acetylglucosamine 1-carboxyvinyltransferase [Elizabethkingia argentiflava]|uniref:UDP-N-acetylglucosamine 1-carboxyvinyltransferase n=1 Tax=Elizabethkingia argenteiflava TaxID=2681556 RepID=A0A845PW21_9FLAO|nr:UDP-N-acetylglucosamine 1-carboxyvinyltransferase [Elizabethkingia argenteiflava]NAW50508.1 UDP-N-acetylglucosamine 1-carboxyvinyltransferase [Elizabethkingia argenteiflava]